MNVCVCVIMDVKGAEERARGGTGTTPEPEVAATTTRKKSTRKSSRRPRVVLEHPDVAGPEFTIRRSFRVQDGVERFLEENVDTSWENLTELYMRAANYVWHLGLLKKRPSWITAQRWIQQYCVVGEAYRLREVSGEGYWVLERRENGRQEAKP